MSDLSTLSEDIESIRPDDGLPTHIPVVEEQPACNSAFGAVLSFLGVILLSFILRLAVPKEDNAVELGLLLIAVGLAQIWLIFTFLKTAFRK